jgi:hypothetical protein
VRIRSVRVQIVSDLHVDHPGSRGVPPLATGVEVVVVADATCQGLVAAVEKAVTGSRDAFRWGRPRLPQPALMAA